MIITPKIAKEILDKNDYFNRINHNGFDSYINTITNHLKNNTWPKEYNYLSFDTDDNLIDGFHRLEAVIKSGLTIDFVIEKTAYPCGMLCLRCFMYCAQRCK